MKIADLFIDLDLKGAMVVGKALGGIQSGLKGAAEMSRTTKAGILGTILAFEELTRSGVNSAIELKNFAGATGLSTAELQKWLYMARMNDVAGDELSETIKGLQSAQAAMALGRGVPEGAVWFGLDPKKNPLEMFAQIGEKLRQIGNDQKQIGIARTMASTLGISDNMFAMLRRGNMSLAGFRKEMLLTGEEQKKLIGINRLWKQFWYDIQNESQKVLAHDLAGPITGAVKLLGDSAKGIGDAIGAIHKVFSKADMNTDKLAHNFKVLAAILAPFGLVVAPVATSVTALALGLADLHRYMHGEDSVIGDILNNPTNKKIGGAFDKGAWSGLKEMFWGDGASGEGKSIEEMMSDPRYKRDRAKTANTLGTLGGMLPAELRAGFVGPPSPIPAVITNNLQLHLHGVHDKDVPQRAANAITNALSRMNKGQ